MQLGHNDAGTTKKVAVGDEITIVLDERPTTGYRWRVEFDPDVLRQVDDHYDGSTAPMGAAGIRKFTFRVTVAAPTTLRLLHGRPWEKSTSDEFTVDLEPA